MATTRHSPSLSPINKVRPLIIAAGWAGSNRMPCNLGGGGLGAGDVSEGAGASATTPSGVDGTVVAGAGALGTFEVVDKTGAAAGDSAPAGGAEAGCG